MPRRAREVKALSDSPTVVVLGGAGGMGRVAVAHAARFDDLGEIVVADLDRAAAEAVVAECQGAAKVGLRAVAIDVTDAAALSALLGPADVVLNTTGPFYRLGVPVLRGAIEAGCLYLDICDDWEPTVEMLGLHDEAAACGVLAVIGMGASPGLSNLMARMACDRLERVDDVYTAWPVDAGVGESAGALDAAEEVGDEGSAALMHWMQQISGRIEVVESGALVSRQPVHPVTLDFPGLGSGTAYTVGHPEPITLRERVGIRGASANLMLLKASTVAFLQGLRDDIDAGRLSHEAAGRQIVEPGLLRQTRALAGALRCPGAGRLPFFFALARGEREGRAVSVGVRATSIPPGMDGVTGVPLALGLRQLLDRRPDLVGVHPPETAIEPTPLFDALAPACEPAKQGLEDLIVVTEAASSA